MPRSPRTAAERLAKHGERLINAWVPADLIIKLDGKLALQWAARPSERRPSRQAFIVEAIRDFVDSSTEVAP
jgi:hypothetical protein